MEEVSKQSLFYRNKQPYEPHDNENNKWEMIKNGAFLDLLQCLGLEHYYSKKLNKANFHLIYKTSVYNTQPSSEWEIPFYFLQKLLIMDYGLRYLVFKDDRNAEHQVYSNASDQEYEAFDPYENFFEDSDSSAKSLSTKPRPHIHPIDIQMTTFHCADDFAR
ncbi:Interferon-induced very large GTPase 1 [Plecturocebus cupreus]